MSLADVTISHEAWSDPRVLFLAQLAKYADGIDTAVAKLARLWARCTFLGSDVLPEIEVNACLGSAEGARLLVMVGLGEATEGGIRVKGRRANGSGKDRLGWYADNDQRNAKGGRNRAANAVRAAGGRFAPAGPATPAERQPGWTGTTSETSQAGPATPAGDQDLRSGSDPLSLRSGLSAFPEIPDPGAIVRADLGEAPPPPEPPPGMELEMPERWEPASDPDLAREAERLGVDLGAELAKLRDRARARGKTSADWQATWREWARRAFEYARRKPPQASKAAVDLAQRFGGSPAPRTRSDEYAERARADGDRERAEIAERDARAAADRDEVRRQLEVANEILRNPAATKAKTG